MFVTFPLKNWKKRNPNFGVNSYLIKGTRTEGHKETWEFLKYICESNDILESKINHDFRRHSRIFKGS